MTFKGVSLDNKISPVLSAKSTNLTTFSWKSGGKHSIMGNTHHLMWGKFHVDNMVLPKMVIV